MIETQQAVATTPAAAEPARSIRPGSASFQYDGFFGPVPLLNQEECASLMARLTVETISKSAVWNKGAAVSNRAFYDIATDPRVLALVRPILGDDIILWGTHLVKKSGDAVHPFHTDCESAATNGRFVSVWVGLEHTGPRSGLKFIPGSHLFGTTIQEVNARSGRTRRQSGEAEALEAAGNFVSNPTIVQPEVADGLALIFDGRVWHGSHNPAGDKARTALLLQYAAAYCPIFIPEHYEWPFAFKASPRPPVLVISGNAPIGVNRIALPPTMGRRRKIPNAVYRLPASPLPFVEQFASTPHLRGKTPMLTDLESHSSILAPGATPHPLHQHREEELLVVVHGEADLMVADDKDGTNLRRERMKAGDFAYYPAMQPHTLTNPTAEPVLYTMFKWSNEVGIPQGELPLTFIRSGQELSRPADATRLSRGALFNCRTGWLNRLHCHVSIAAPGKQYEAHADKYDVAIILFAGSVDTLGQTVAAPAMLFHPAGQLHGMSSVGPNPARYLVFEFQRAKSKSVTPQPRPPVTGVKALAKAIQDFARRAKRRLLKLAGRRRQVEKEATALERR